MNAAGTYITPTVVFPRNAPTGAIIRASKSDETDGALFIDAVVASLCPCS